MMDFSVLLASETAWQNPYFGSGEAHMQESHDLVKAILCRKFFFISIQKKADKLIYFAATGGPAGRWIE